MYWYHAVFFLCFIPIKLVKGHKIFWTCTSRVYIVTRSKYAPKYEQMRKVMVEFLSSKFQGRGIKIARVNSVRVARPIDFIHISSPHVTSLQAIVLSLYILPLANLHLLGVFQRCMSSIYVLLHVLFQLCDVYASVCRRLQLSGVEASELHALCSLLHARALVTVTAHRNARMAKVGGCCA